MSQIDESQPNSEPAGRDMVRQADAAFGLVPARSPARRRRPSSAGARRGSGHCESSASPPAHELSRASRFMPLALLKPFLWAGTILPWRKTKGATAGADSRKQEMVPEVLQAPSWRTLSTRFGRSLSDNQMSTSQATAAQLSERTAVDMLEPDRHEGPRAQSVPFSTDLKRSNTEPSGRDMVRQAGAAFGGAAFGGVRAVERESAFGGVRARSPARSPAFDAPSHQHHHHAKGSPVTGAGARLLDRVHQLRAQKAAAKSVAPPKLYGTVIGHAEPVEGFSVPKNLHSVA